MDVYALNYSFVTLCVVAAVCFLLGRWSKSDGPARHAKPIGEIRNTKPPVRRNINTQASSRSPTRHFEHHLSENAEREVEDLLARGHLIAAIKVVRSDLGIGLREAKNMVDNLRRNM